MGPTFGKGEGWDGGKISANLHNSNYLTPSLALPLKGGGNK